MKEDFKARVDDYIVAKLSELQSKIDETLEVAERYAQIDGEHHKAWVIDQMVRALTGKNYNEWIKECCAEDEEGECYEWDTGIAP